VVDSYPIYIQILTTIGFHVFRTVLVYKVWSLFDEAYCLAKYHNEVYRQWQFAQQSGQSDLWQSSTGCLQSGSQLDVELF